jgi:Transposase IS4
MILRRSKRTPVPTTRWEEKVAPSAAVDPKITKKTVKTKQKTSFKSVTIGTLPQPIELDKNDLPKQSKRISVPETGWKQTGAPPIALDPKITEETARTTQKTALKPVIVGSLSKALELDRNDLPKLSTYNPPLNLQFQASESLATGLTELETFQRLLTPAIVDRIVAATNSYAENARKIDEDTGKMLLHYRPWKPVNSAEIWRFIGCLLYMEVHIEAKYEDHWSKTGHLSKFMSLIYYDQIYRYFTLRDGAVEPRKEEEIFTWKVESMAIIVKQNCKKLWLPSFYLAVDEAIIAYRGRSVDKVKLPNKSIKKGYKVWVLGDASYVYD